jgi:hypothetical protein
MMKRVLALAVLAGLLLGSAAAWGATEVKMSGDARIWADWWSNMNYTGWNPTGTKTNQSMTIWELFRLKMDFVTDENLKFRFGIRVMNIPWGGAAALNPGVNSGFLLDNPAVNISVYLAFMQFKWPGSNVEFTVGYQDLDLPISADMLYANPVLGITRGAGALVKIPVCDNFKIQGGFIRFVDGNPGFEPSTTTLADRLDGYVLTLPISVEGFKATPWSVLGVLGRDAAALGASIPVGVSPRLYNQNIGNNLLAPITYVAPATFLRQAQSLYWWVGTTLSLTALDPFQFYGDIIYGAGAQNDKSLDKRAGLFLDVAAEYTGFNLMTPQATFWYSTGEDKSLNNGSERMPVIDDNWGPSSSFLFNNSQVFTAGYMGLNPIGSWGFALSLDKISFIQDLKHRITFTFAGGTNSPSAIRLGNLYTGNGSYFQLGRDLTTQEYEYGVNFDHQYNIYENLAAVVETGWSHGNFQTSVWGHRFTNATRNGDAWKVTFGLKYLF